MTMIKADDRVDIAGLRVNRRGKPSARHLFHAAGQDASRLHKPGRPVDFIVVKDRRRMIRPAAYIEYIASERAAELCGRLQNPVPVKRQRRDAGEAAAAVRIIRPRRPRDDADDNGLAILFFEHRRAGIAGAGAKPVSRAARETGCSLGCSTDC